MVSEMARNVKKYSYELPLISYIETSFPKV